MLGGLFSRMLGGAPAPAPVPAPSAAAVPARPDAHLAIMKWLADDTLPSFSMGDLRADPRRYAIATTLATGANPQEPMALARQLLADDPGNAIDRLLMIELLLRSGEVARAQEMAASALTDQGRMGARAATQLAECALFMGDLPRARELAERAVSAAPDSVAAHIVLACVLDAQGPYAEANYARARGHHERALALRLDLHTPRTYLAASLLRQELLHEGLMHWVLAEMQRDIYSNRETCPVWGGQPLGRQRLLVIAHSGFGDMIQFLRFARQLRAREPDAHLALVISAPVARLAESTGWFDEVHSNGVQEPFDWQVTQTHLPLLLDVRMEDLLEGEPYLRVPAPQVQVAAGWLPPVRPGHLRIGLRWAGNPGLLDAKRNIPLGLCAPLFEIPGLEWVALVEDAVGAAQARQFGLTEAAAHIADFQDTAALMCNLDLIIAVDSSVANLGGALNLPTWVMSRPDPDWRWGKSGALSPWYSSVRVFRHPPDGGVDWSAVIADIAPALQAWAQEKSASRDVAT